MTTTQYRLFFTRDPPGINPQTKEPRHLKQEDLSRVMALLEVVHGGDLVRRIAVSGSHFDILGMHAAMPYIQNGGSLQAGYMVLNLHFP